MKQGASTMRESYGLTKNQLKLLAVVFMTIDHVGMILFPGVSLFRIVGRLAFPVFSYSIYEGCRYTRKPVAYLCRMFGLGFFCALVQYFYTGEVFGNILITFSLSICILYCVNRLKREIYAPVRNPAKILSAVLFVLVSISLTAVLCLFIEIDYGFLGVLLPVFAEIFDIEPAVPDGTYRKSKSWYPLLGFFAGLVLLSSWKGGIQYYSCLSILFLAASSGEQGKCKLKYFFYIYYPLHLFVIEMIAELLIK